MAPSRLRPPSRALAASAALCFASALVPAAGALALPSRAPAAGSPSAHRPPRTHADARARPRPRRKPSCTPAAAPYVVISPLPGATAAPARAQISFRGAPAADLREISVVGSRSRVHAGSLRSYHAARGASYVLASPFTPGEHVQVHATVTTRRGCRRIASAFTVAREARPPLEPAFEYPGTPGEMQHFESNNVKPPVLTVTQPAGPASAPGDLFATPSLGPAEHGPMIFESSGRLVWFHLLPTGDNAADFRTVDYQGQTDLLWWQGEITSAGFGLGEGILYDSAYRQVARIAAGNGLSADLHELEVTPRGSAFISAYQPIRISTAAADGRPPPHRRGRHAPARTRVVLDCVVQEIDVATGLVMWEWDSVGHVPLSQSRVPPPPLRAKPYDYFQLAAVQRLAGGNLAVAARGALASYEVAGETGHVLRRTAIPASGFGALEGDEEPLPGGDRLLYHSEASAFTEVGPQGQPLYQASFPAGDLLGRVYRQPWTGEPGGRPGVATKLSATNTEVTVSWNGQTRVASWELLVGGSPNSLQPAATVPDTGFETEFVVPQTPYAQVLGFDAAGQLVAESNVKETVREGEE
ncbi:MAG: arylsulfotransferase family protein [Solirubrobacteraceae bacterium]